MRKLLLAFVALLFAHAAHAQLLGVRSAVSPSNPTGTTDTTGKMMGLGADASNPCTIRVQKTGVVLFIITFKGVNNTASDGFAAQLSYGTGTAPANAAAAAGTQVGAFMGSDNTATVQEAQTAIAIVTGLSLNTTYWFDLYLKAVTGGTASVTNVTCSAVELAQ